MKRPKSVFRKIDRLWWRLPFWINAIPFSLLILADALSGSGGSAHSLSELKQLRTERRGVHGLQ
jgi:hypothetical protein